MARGASNYEGSGFKYMTVSQGKFVQKVDQPTATSETRILEKGANAGQERHEEKYDTFEGQLLHIRQELHSEYGKFWEFIFDTTIDEHQPEKTIIKVGFKSGYAMNILSRLPNCKLNEDLILKGYNFKPEGKNKNVMGISISQASQGKVEPKFTKENPNGCPPMKEVLLDGEKKWDQTERLAFFEKLVASEINPQLPGIQETQPAQPSSPPPTDQPVQSHESAVEFDEDGNPEGDDLPF